ncbi:hypothetical protein ACFQDG_14965 [Natronoarchaeum mannanilyticum]|uniref:Uncharacterized protein n=1 Tax=Natronoarchaeum mannanilyticum TaxID=926360 RepID=A0AAV3TCV9_9EURY
MVDDETPSRDAAPESSSGAPESSDVASDAAAHDPDATVPDPDAVLADAEEHLPGRSLSPEEYEHLKRSVAELTPIFRHDRSYFVLGSYGTPEVRRLQLVKDRLNRRRDAYAFLMVDVRREWTNTYLKFRLLADYADLIVGVAEHDGGGFLVEQGTVVTEPAYFEKTHFLKREYDGIDAEAIDTDADPDDPYSGMQTPLFELADEAGRLHVWRTESELEDCVEELP